MSGNDSFTKILLHFDGSNNGTTITDSNAGGSAHTWTAQGSAVTSTAKVKFGTAAFFGPSSSGNYVSTPDHADFTLGSGDFTIDCWFSAENGLNNKILCGQGGSSDISFYIRLESTNKIQLHLSADGLAETTVTSTSTFTSTGWHHVAAVRTGTTLKLFIDGVQEGGDVSFSGSVHDSTGTFCVGVRTGNLNSWDGYIDEFRLSVGTARWTSNFTPPAVAYDVDSNVGAAAGTGAAAGVGASKFSAVGAADGAAAASGVGIGSFFAVGSAVGVGTAIAVPSNTPDGVGTAGGTGAALGVGAATANSIGAATGVGGTTPVLGVGVASGNGLALGTGAILVRSVGSASGSGAATVAGLDKWDQMLADPDEFFVYSAEIQPWILTDLA